MQLLIQKSNPFSTCRTTAPANSTVHICLFQPHYRIQRNLKSTRTNLVLHMTTNTYKGICVTSYTCLRLPMREPSLDPTRSPQKITKKFIQTLAPQIHAIHTTKLKMQVVGWKRYLSLLVFSKNRVKTRGNRVGTEGRGAQSPPTTMTAVSA